MQLVNVYHTFTCNTVIMVTTNKMQMVLSHDNNIIVSNGQQSPVTSASHNRLHYPLLILERAKSRPHWLLLIYNFQGLLSVHRPARHRHCFRHRKPCDFNNSNDKRARKCYRKGLKSALYCV